MAFTPTPLSGVTKTPDNPLLATLLQQAIADKAKQDKGLLGGIDAGQVGAAVQLAGQFGGEGGSKEQDPNFIGPPAPKTKEKNGFLAETGEVGAGALTGAKIGAVGGPVGIGIGAIIGGLLGLFG